jgi:uncharacterized membrane protein
MVSNNELKNRALEKLRDNWTVAVVATLVYMLLVAAMLGVGSFAYGFGAVLVCFLVIPLMEAGWMQAFLSLFREEKEGKTELINLIFRPFSEYGRYLGTLLLAYLYTFLWSLLFFVPGVIKSLSYAMTPYILKDHPELKNNGAIELSMDMMEGRKMKLFLLQLGFIGWAILAIIPLGLGVLWLAPYTQTSYAAFYEEAKEEYWARIARDEEALA